MTLIAPKPSLHDEVVAHLREHGEGVSAVALASRFLKLKNAPRLIAESAIKAILANDRRVIAGEDGLWRAARGVSSGGKTLQHLPWSAVYCLADPSMHRLLHVSIWDLYPAPSCTYAAWLVDPKILPYDEGELLQGDADASVAVDRDGDRNNDPENQAVDLARDLAERLPVFLTSAHRELLSSWCAEKGDNLPDDTVTARELLKAAGCAVPRMLDLALLEKAVLGTAQSGENLLKQGERFATALYELVELLKRKGIETRNDLDHSRPQETEPLFAGKKFSYDDILALPALPGVYAFKDVAGKHCYIGKANNLRRRLQSYWTDSDESPVKLSLLREQAHTFVTHRCGSELESLLLEYRLIKKHMPPLNKKVDIVERKGAFRPVDDCIVLLPHAEPGKGMSIWFRKNQKILLKPFDAAFPCEQDLVAELESFFFSHALSAEPSDFPEQEIATRWIKRHADTLALLQVGRTANAEELLDAFKILWREFGQSRQMTAVA